jgi:hypothetical protein
MLRMKMRIYLALSGKSSWVKKKENRNGMFTEITIANEIHLTEVLTEIMATQGVLPIMKVVPLAANAPATRITGMMTMIGYNSILDF